MRFMNRRTKKALCQNERFLSTGILLSPLLVETLLILLNQYN